MAAGDVVWYARSVTAGSGTLRAWTSPDWPDGAVVDEERLSGRDLDELTPLWQASFQPDSGRLLAVVCPSGAAGLWYVEVPEPDADPPAVSLIAYDTEQVAAGSVIDNDTFEPLDVRNDDQVGAVRWFPGTGQVDQIYVAPRRRRQGIATTLLYAASAHLVASGSPQRLWSAGDRTDLGEALARGLPHPQRVQARRSVAAPMTPADQAEGVPSRNLNPEP